MVNACISELLLKLTGNLKINFRCKKWFIRKWSLLLIKTDCKKLKLGFKPNLWLLCVCSFMFSVCVCMGFLWGFSHLSKSPENGINKFKNISINIHHIHIQGLFLPRMPCSLGILWISAILTRIKRFYRLLNITCIKDLIADLHMVILIIYNTVTGNLY